MESAPLNSFCQQLKDAFTEAELLVEDKRSLLLHATIVNTIYVPGSKRTNLRKAGEGHGKKKNRLVFDASDLIEEVSFYFTFVMGSFSWVLFNVREALFLLC